MNRPQIALLVSLLGCATMAPLAFAQWAPPRAAKAIGLPGEATYQKWCSDCHSTPAGPGSIALQRKYQGTPPAVLLQRTDLSSDLVKAAVRNGASFMPSFRKTEITDPELAALAGYLTPPKGRAMPAKARR